MEKLIETLKNNQNIEIASIDSYVVNFKYLASGSYASVNPTSIGYRLNSTDIYGLSVNCEISNLNTTINKYK